MFQSETYRFKPSLSLFLLTFLLILLFVGLGVWQLNRAKDKQALMNLYDQHQRDQPIVLKQDNHDVLEMRYRKVIVTGEYDTRHQILLDNQVLEGQAGYFVLTPLQIEGTDVLVLVNRGWIPVGEDRSMRPRLDVLQKRVRITGTIEKFPAVGLTLKDAEVPSGEWPAVVQVIDSRYLAGLFGYNVLPYQVLLDATAGEGYLRAWRPAVLFPERHRAYALQWFAFALTLAILFVWRSFEARNGA